MERPLPTFLQSYKNTRLFSSSPKPYKEAWEGGGSGPHKDAEHCCVCLPGREAAELGHVQE